MVKALLFVALALAYPAGARERLVLIGGGDPPSQAISAFSRWSGGERARVLVVTWSTVNVQGALDWVQEELAPHHPAEIEASPLAADVDKNMAQLSRQLARATGLYFTGGDQNLFMNVISKFPRLRDEMRRRLSAGVPILGTSAGTAVLAATMFTGDYDPTSPNVVNGELKGIDPAAVIVAPGLGFLGNILVDQHFFARSRQNRFWSAFAKSPESLGLGIDESTAVLLEDYRWGEVVGEGAVLAARRGTNGLPDLSFHLKHGDRIDLSRFRRL
jgi:cyanophycinase